MTAFGCEGETGEAKDRGLGRRGEARDETLKAIAARQSEEQFFYVRIMQ